MTNLKWIFFFPFYINHTIIGYGIQSPLANRVEKTILFNMSGHGLVDLAAYDAYFSGKLSDYALPEEEIERALKTIESLPKINAGVMRSF